jgi:hypothetical protein
MQRDTDLKEKSAQFLYGMMPSSFRIRKKSKCHSERSEESKTICKSKLVFKSKTGFFCIFVKKHKNVCLKRIKF